MSVLVQPLAAGNESLFGGRVSRRQQDSAKLNLVSLMDIFTILVFFLMVNTGDVEVLQPDESIVLPQSYADAKPDTSPLVKVNGEALLFREQVVMPLVDLAENGELVDPLYKLLKQQAALQSQEDDTARSISIMATVDLPYETLKKILNTCAQAGFRDISLAVEYSSRASVGEA